MLLDAEMLFRTLAPIALHLDDMKFAFQLVQSLNMILLTASELHDLRMEIKHLRTEVSCAHLSRDCLGFF